ncbi:hypothetical protein [Companilactobacillus jidongensis]|uniref:hypothetical protein n=1 Tax=Companilactobacillus jidongensis TaxID=2486006 RepID=UPI000F78E910|nr:hypothetical protein [Companilactobacillus jidongensis]
MASYRLGYKIAYALVMLVMFAFTNNQVIFAAKPPTNNNNNNTNVELPTKVDSAHVRFESDNLNIRRWIKF